MQPLKTKSLERYNHGLIAFAGILVVVVLLVLVLSMYGKNDGNETVLVPDNYSMPIVEQPIFREITGTILSIDASGEYMRVAIPGEGIFSVGINRPEYTFNEIDLLALEPMSEITFVAEVKADTAMYDFAIEESVVQKMTEEESSATEMTIDERVERLRLLTPEMR